MSLYGDLESNGSKTNKEQRLAGWGSNMKMLESQKKLQQSRQLGFSKVKKAGNATIAPVVDLKRRNDDQTPFSFNSSTGRMEQVNTECLSQEEIDNAASTMPNNIAVGEYDPLRPNEYESSVRRNKRSTETERTSNRKVKETKPPPASPPHQRENNFRQRNDRKDRNRDSYEDAAGEDYSRSDGGDSRRDSRGDGRSEYTRDVRVKSKEGRADARGDGNDGSKDRSRDRADQDFARDREFSRDNRNDRDNDRDDHRNNDDYRGRDRTSNEDRPRRYEDDSRNSPNSDDEDTDDRAGAAIAPPSFLQNSDPPSQKSQQKPNIASKIMAKMGYKRGQGLGREDQGMANPLTVERTSKTSCKILHEDEVVEQMMPPPMFTPSVAPFTIPANSSEHNYPPITSNAALMSNPTRVILLRNMVSPGEVDEELEDETASECSKYGKVIKCTICENFQVDNEEGVRVFLQFEKVDSAIRAVIDLNGRFFGGRSVKATFYNVDDFKTRKLNNQA